MKTITLTMAQALIKFLDNQYVALDNEEYKFVKGVFGIFGHGNVTGIGEALENEETNLTYIQGHNEQGMAHAATAFAKQSNRLQIFACTSSIGPGALNMVTAAATATVNRIPVLLLPGDIFASRQPDPVLQQIEVPSDYTISANDAFKPVSKFWDRITRPEQLMTSLMNAFRVLTDPVDTGAVTICLPQDVQAEAYDYPLEFFNRRVWHIDRREVGERALSCAVEKIKQAKKPLIIAGGGVHYSWAEELLQDFANAFKIPVAETQAGKSCLSWDDPMNVGGIGVMGTQSANLLARNADLIFAIGTRLNDFITTSKWSFANPEVQIIHLNVSALDGNKMGALLLQGDAGAGLAALRNHLIDIGYQTPLDYQKTIQSLRETWDAEVNRLYSISDDNNPSGSPQTAVLGAINNFVDESDIVVCAAGSLPGDLQRLWRASTPKSYHLEYGFSCMGYEVAGGLGVKIAEPEREVYVLVGDGSFLMLHSELVTSIQEGYKINIIVLDNHGYQCIKNLQISCGSKGFGNEFRHRDESTGHLDGEVVGISFADYAKSLGAVSYFANDVNELQQHLASAKQQTRSTVIEIKVAPGTMSDGYESWWHVPVAEVSKSQNVIDAHKNMQAEVKKARLY